MNQTIFEPVINDEKIDSAFQPTEIQELIIFLETSYKYNNLEGLNRIESNQLALLFLGANEKFTITKPKATSGALFMRLKCICSEDKLVYLVNIIFFCIQNLFYRCLRT